MKRLLALPTGFASRICAPCSVVLMLTSATALAQSTDAANPPAPAQSSAQDEASGGCEPIGLTASGEIVFPFRCKGVVERQRAAAAKPAEPKPAVAAAAPEKPHAQPAAANAKTIGMLHPAAIPPRGTARAVAVPVGAAHAPKTAEAKTAEAKTVEGKSVEGKTSEGKTVEITKGIQRAAGAAHDYAMGPPGCSQFRSYHAVSATYLAFDGQHRPCHEVAGQPSRSRVAGNQPAPKQISHTASPAAVKP